MTQYFEVFLKKDRWNVRKQFAKRRLTTETFDTAELAEQWIKDNYKPKYHFDTPWIDHEIEKHRGHLMTIEEWKECVDEGGFIDYDGDGDMLDAKYRFLTVHPGEKLYGSSIRPSDYTKKKIDIPARAKYVLWYNR